MAGTSSSQAAVSTTPLCRLCGLETGSAREEFCCAGCGNVYTILVESGALQPGIDPRDTELFRRSLEAGLVSTRQAALAAAAVPEAPPEEAEELALEVSGMWCTACAWLIEHALLKERGVIAADVLFASDLVKVRYQPRFLPPARIRERIERLGYRATPYSPGQDAAPDRHRALRRDLQLRLGVAAFFWANVMTLSMIFYVGYFERISDSMRHYIPFVLMALTAPVILFSARPVLRSAWGGLREGVLRMEALLGLGILAAFGYSSVLAFTGGEHYYFDIACAIVTFVLSGKLLETAAKERTARAVTLLHRMMPRKARLIEEGGRERWIAVEGLEPGTEFFVKPGERVPADGVVAAGGASVFDESVITGESRPVPRAAGEAVVGGSLNTGAAVAIRATAAAGEGTLHRMIRSVESALGSRAHIERTVDRVSRGFIPAVMAIAVATFAAWTWGAGNMGAGILNAISVLVIACPCALGIATPLAISSAVGAASRHGILINQAAVLENAGSIDTVVFDKTGTVTEGRFAAAGFYSESVAEAEAMARLAPLEAASEHPLARAVVERAAALGIEAAPAPGVVRREGLGLTCGGVFAGNARLAAIETGDAALPAALSAKAEAWQQEGLTAVYFGWDGVARGVLALGDPLRPDARGAVAALNARHVETILLSGDSQATTRAAAQSLGAGQWRAEARPEDKAAYVEALRSQGRRVAMVGDGVNDAPALAHATLGIAMGSGAALAMQAAPVVLMTPSLDRIGATFDLAARTLSAVRRNLFWAFFYNAAGITLAAAGYLNPIVAGAAMILSSLSVTIQSSRLGKWRPAGE